ncbi:MAG: hypothetical protein APF77_10640 [Clostridia bacterium BRH_c25]|nr:MAG: hypothetical protein APF77_10640 [Clostridia bacterium BRH_c25]
MKIKVHQDIYVGIFIILCCAAFFTMTIGLPTEAVVFPVSLLAIIALLALWILWDGVRKTKAATAEQPIDNPVSLSKIKIPFITFLYIAGYVALFRFAGYFVATIVFMIALMRRFRLTSWKQILLITAGFVIIIYTMFVKQLNVPVLDFGYLQQVVEARW